MEFSLAASLANNVTNLLLDPLTKEAVKDNLDGSGYSNGTRRRPG